MVRVVFIDRTGEARTANVRDLNRATLHKKCKFRSAAHFAERAVWKYGDAFVTLFAKDAGSAGSENKFELPPPVDSDLFFGTMLLCAHETAKLGEEGGVDFTKEAWAKLYEKLLGGFEDLGEEEEEEEEEDVIPEGMATKNGYSKESGFVVDDSDSVSVGASSGEESEFSAKGSDDSDMSDDEEEKEKDYGESSIESGAAMSGDESDADDDDEDDAGSQADDEDGAGSELVEEEYSYSKN